MLRLLPVTLALLALVPGAQAQLGVTGIRDLNFGVVLPGVQSPVAPTDPIKSGQFYIRTAAPGTRVRLRFTLPTQLNGPGGATMPIAFANRDALVQGTAPGSRSVFFNPNRNRNYRMLPAADANVWLGGTVRPTARQAVGNYRATVVLTVTVF